MFLPLHFSTSLPSFLMQEELFFALENKSPLHKVTSINPLIIWLSLLAFFLPSFFFYIQSTIQKCIWTSHEILHSSVYGIFFCLRFIFALLVNRFKVSITKLPKSFLEWWLWRLGMSHAGWKQNPKHDRGESPEGLQWGLMLCRRPAHEETWWLSGWWTSGRLSGNVTLKKSNLAQKIADNKRLFATWLVFSFLFL